MRKLFFKKGDRVGVIRFDPNTNKDYLDEGKIVARRLRAYSVKDFDIEYTREYAVEFQNGKIELYCHDELWKIKKHNKKGRVGAQ